MSTSSSLSSLPKPVSSSKSPSVSANTPSLLHKSPSSSGNFPTSFANSPGLSVNFADTSSLSSDDSKAPLDPQVSKAIADALDQRLKSLTSHIDAVLALPSAATKQKSPKPAIGLVSAL